MRITLFHDLLNLVSTYFPKGNLTEDEFLYYLLGYYSKKYNKSIPYDTFPPSDLALCIKGKKELHSVLGDYYSKVLDVNHQIQLEDIIFIPHSYNKSQIIVRTNIETLKHNSEDIIKLYNTYSLPLPNKDAEHLLLDLFTICITEKREYLFESYKNQQLKPQTLKSTKGRECDAEKLRKELDQYHKIIISDEYGIGKSHFIKYCLSVWKLKDYCYINYTENLESTISSIKYKKDYSDKYMNTSQADLKDEDFSSSLLVIDHMYYSSNFKEELHELASYAINVIVITVNTVPTGSFHSFQMSPLPDSILWDIFQTVFPIPSCDETLKESLLCLTQKNTLMLSLVAHQCKKISNISSDFVPSEVLEQVLLQLIVLEKHMDFGFKGNYKFKHRYTNKTLDLIGHVKSVYMNFFDNAAYSLQEQMKYLCCFGWTPLPLGFLSKVLPNYNEQHLKQLSDWGLLSLTDEFVQISPLIVHAVFSAGEPSPVNSNTSDGDLPSINYKILVENMTDFLNNFDKELDVPYLEDVLFIFVQTLYKNIPFQNNPKQEKTAKEFENWQDFIYLVYHYYNECGDFFAARKIASTIYYPGLVNAHSPFDTIFLHLGNNMQFESSVNTMCSQIDNALTNDFTSATNTTYFYINSLNTIIRFYCISLLSVNEISSKDYQYFLRCVIGKILSFITEPEHDTTISIDDDKLYYYQMCYQIMENPLFSFDSNYLSRIQSLDNLNYRIRGMAFLIFLESYYIILGYIKYNPSFILKAFAEKIAFLHNQIQRCRLIPFQTSQLCIYSYISVAALQHGIYSNKENIQQPISPIFDISHIADLGSRTIMSKEDIQSIMDYLGKYMI